jgi:hypothetical protein
MAFAAERPGGIVTFFVRADVGVSQFGTAPAQSVTGFLARGPAEFDSTYSAASWYRAYVAYCGASDDGQENFRGRRATQPPQNCAEENSGVDLSDAEDDEEASK